MLCVCVSLSNGLVCKLYWLSALLFLPIVPHLAGALSRRGLRRIPEQMIAPTAHVEQDHSVHNALALILKQHRLAVPAIGTVQIVRSTQRRILHQVIHDTRLFFRHRHEIVAVHQRFARFLLVVAVATCV